MMCIYTSLSLSLSLSLSIYKYIYIYIYIYISAGPLWATRLRRGCPVKQLNSYLS